MRRFKYFSMLLAMLVWSVGFVACSSDDDDDNKDDVEVPGNTDGSDAGTSGGGNNDSQGGEISASLVGSWIYYYDGNGGYEKIEFDGTGHGRGEVKDGDGVERYSFAWSLNAETSILTLTYDDDGEIEYMKILSLKEKTLEVLNDEGTRVTYTRL